MEDVPAAPGYPAPLPQRRLAPVERPHGAADDAVDNRLAAVGDMPCDAAADVGASTGIDVHVANNGAVDVENAAAPHGYALRREAVQAYLVRRLQDTLDAVVDLHHR